MLRECCTDIAELLQKFLQYITPQCKDNTGDGSVLACLTTNLKVGAASLCCRAAMKSEAIVVKSKRIAIMIR